VSIPEHITAAIRDGKMTYCGEAQLSNHGETARKGQYVEFFLDDGPDGSERHPFKGLKTGREKGQRFGLIAVPLDDDDAVAAPVGQEKTKRHWSDMTRSQKAALRCKDPEFQKWAWKKDGCPRGWMPAEPSESHATQWLRERCGVASRAGLDSNPEAAAAFDELMMTFEQSTGRMAERIGG